MRVSKKTYYGLRAITALAEHGELSVHDLAALENMPEDYLHKILQILKRHGIVSSEKGAHGGYTLARPTTSVSVWDIVSTLDGGFKSFAPPRLTNVSPYPKLTHCQTNQVWRELEQKIETTLSATTLDQIITPTIHP
jgi:Rrf2 family protein